MVVAARTSMISKLVNAVKAAGEGGFRWYDPDLHVDLEVHEHDRHVLNAFYGIELPVPGVHRPNHGNQNVRVRQKLRGDAVSLALIVINRLKLAHYLAVYFNAEKSKLQAVLCDNGRGQNAQQEDRPGGPRLTALPGIKRHGTLPDPSALSARLPR